MDQDTTKTKHTIINQDQLLHLAELSQQVDMELERFILVLAKPEKAGIAELLEAIRKIQLIRKEINAWIRDRSREMDILV